MKNSTAECNYVQMRTSRRDYSTDGRVWSDRSNSKCVPRQLDQNGQNVFYKTVRTNATTEHGCTLPFLNMKHALDERLR